MRSNIEFILSLYVDDLLLYVSNLRKSVSALLA